MGGGRTGKFDCIIVLFKVPFLNIPILAVTAAKEVGFSV